MTQYALCYFDEECGEWAAMDSRMVESRKAALATLPEIERLQKSINELYNFVGRDFAHLEPKQALEAHMAAVVKDAVAELEQRGEPVAWRYISRVSKKADYIYTTTKKDWADSGTGLWTETPLYLAAPSPEDK